MHGMSRGERREGKNCKCLPLPRFSGYTLGCADILHRQQKWSFPSPYKARSFLPFFCYQIHKAKNLQTTIPLKQETKCIWFQDVLEKQHSRSTKGKTFPQVVNIFNFFFFLLQVYQPSFNIEKKIPKTRKRGLNALCIFI